MSSDEALFEQLLAGELDAFDELYRRYERRLFGFILNYLPERQAAEEVFHEAFLTLLREREKGRPLRSFRAWLFQVTRNLCLNRLRGRRRSNKATAELASNPRPPAEGPERALLRQEAAAALQRAVAGLPNPLRELYHLRSGGMSYEELAQVLEVPQGTVKSRMNKMLSCLRQEMQS